MNLLNKKFIEDNIELKNLKLILNKKIWFIIILIVLIIKKNCQKELIVKHLININIKNLN